MSNLPMEEDLGQDTAQQGIARLGRAEVWINTLSGELRGHRETHMELEKNIKNAVVF